MKTELVSVIINSHNGSKYINRSVTSALMQSYKNLEIIFWDNASTDNTKEIIHQANFDQRFKYFYSGNFDKLYKAKNKAVKLAGGKYLAFLDVDDWWMRDKLIKQISIMEEKKSIISSTNYFIFNEKKKNKTKKIFKSNIDTFKTLESALKKYFVGMSTLIIKKDFYESLEYGFNSDFEVIGDFDLVIRALKKTNILFISEPLSYYRWHHLNLSHRKFRLNILELIKWKNTLKKKNFFNSLNLKIINDHLIYLIALYYKNTNKSFKLLLFLKKLNNIKKKIMIIIIFLLPKKIFKILKT